jgi:predicted nuclease of restriction endonuclease-like (RecB) superfamily
MSKKADKKQPGLLATAAALPAASLSPGLLTDVRRLIESARQRAATGVNAELTLLYWQIGTRVRQEVLLGDRAVYGEQIVHALSTQLTADYGPGFTRTNLFNMIRFAEVYPEEQIVHALRGQLSWSHLRQIVYLDDPLARDFYVQMSRLERWSTRTLEQRIRSMLFERTAISRKPAKLIEQELAALRTADKLTPDLVFRDPYVLDFLGLADTFSEKDVESAICRELERFLLELGSDFTFVARQKRITVDHEDYYLDLLFYHRGLRRLVAIDLKLGRFQAADKGQMELYLRWLEAHERRQGEEPPVGLILCAGKNDEHIELLRLGAAGIRVAEYLTELPPKEMLARKLHDAIRLARRRLEQTAAPTAPPALPGVCSPQNSSEMAHPEKTRQEAGGRRNGATKGPRRRAAKQDTNGTNRTSGVSKSLQRKSSNDKRK